ncbi:telomere repeats-binding bouquet formation protein 1 isoform X2 [Mastacembelus armatus]|uniref:telomere repeats-binding bouquet formation protein 1 isoform X2 n=1 Tax=Mastacembelus armatus TaxID=205130 RepID=UPI000E464A65|nr:telomere repeats-binding bouquet formation protein 1 isoform X2 [Mastacembelus armatus]
MGRNTPSFGALTSYSMYCKNSLCRKETFVDLAGWLMKEDIPLTQKRVSVYLLSVLVANNKLGQTLAQTTGCLDILLDLYRTTFPLSTDATLKLANATQTHRLWTSVSSALCGCVNNPQNVEGQCICVAAFPMIKIWLQQIGLPSTEIFKPICSFIAMSVANNSCVQESFSALGGLETLTLVLVRLVSAVNTSIWSCQLCVTISKTLSACITDNSVLASSLAQYAIVSHLSSLLTSPNLDPEDRLSVLLTLGHCTEASGEHQSQLVQCGGLPLIITFLTEDTSEEVRKAATFILQNCKQATMSLGVPVLMARNGESENAEPLRNIEGFTNAARKLLHRIDRLEKRQEADDKLEDTDPPTSNEGLEQPSLASAFFLALQGSIKTIPTELRQTHTAEYVEAGGDNSMIRTMITKGNCTELKKINSSVSTLDENTKTSGQDMWCSVCRGTGVLSSHAQSLEGRREPQTDRQLFKPPAPVMHNVPKEIKCTTEEDSQDCDMNVMEKIPAEDQSLSRGRCAGCVLPFEEMTSRTFACLQTSCLHSCDMHKVLQEATERFRTHHGNLLFRRECQSNTVKLAAHNSDRGAAAQSQRSHCLSELCLTPINKEEGKVKSSLPEHHWNKHNGITLTPMHKRDKKQPFTTNNKTSFGLTPLKRQPLPAVTERRGENKSGHRVDDKPKTSTHCCSTCCSQIPERLNCTEEVQRRRRKDFSHEEVHYLLRGVKTFGFSWNSILWSYPFQPGRTNVDLAKKYRRLMKGKAQDAGCA